MQYVLLCLYILFLTPSKRMYFWSFTVNATFKHINEHYSFIIKVTHFDCELVLFNDSRTFDDEALSWGGASQRLAWVVIHANSVISDFNQLWYFCIWNNSVHFKIKINGYLFLDLCCMWSKCDSDDRYNNRKAAVPLLFGYVWQIFICHVYPDILNQMWTCLLEFCENAWLYCINVCCDGNTANVAVSFKHPIKCVKCIKYSILVRVCCAAPVPQTSLVLRVPLYTFRPVFCIDCTVGF